MPFLRTGSGRAVAALVVTYAVGIVGLLVPLTRAGFVLLSPAQLMLTIVLLLSYHPGITSRVVVGWVVVFALGFGVEVLGVNTGWPFGRYEYGMALGPKLWHTPLLIGINWLILVYAAVAVSQQLLPNRRSIWIAITTAAIMALLDLLIEPVAISLGFWHWYGRPVPLQNYVSWFVCAWLLALLLQRFNQSENHSPVAPWVLGFQVAFFTILALFL